MRTRIAIVASIALLFIVAAGFPYPSVGLYYISTADPTVQGVNAPPYQLMFRTDVPSVYYKSGASSTAWTMVGGGSASFLNPTATKWPIISGGGWSGPCVFNGTDAVSNFSRSGTTYTASNAASCTDASVTAGVTVITCGYPLTISGTLSGSGDIGCPGNNASGITAGAARAAGALPGGSAGGNGAINGASSGGNGGAGNYFPAWCGVNGTATTSVGVTTAGVTNTPQRCMGGGGGARVQATSCDAVSAGANGGSLTTMYSYSQDPSTWYLGNAASIVFGHQGGGLGPATGGGGGAACINNGCSACPTGGGAGGAAGWTSIVANRSTFTGRILARGGEAANGATPNVAGVGAAVSAGGGGGGGGAGNFLYFVYGSGVTYTSGATTCTGAGSGPSTKTNRKCCSSSGSTYCVSGGGGGAAGAANGTGSAGTDGIDGGDGWAVVVNLTGQS